MPGRRQAPTAAPASTQERPSAATKYVVGRKPIKVGEETLQPGDPVPGAEDWPRLESRLRTGMLRPA